MNFLKKYKKWTIVIISVVVIFTLFVYLFLGSEQEEFAAKFEDQIITYEELNNHTARTVNFYNTTDQDYQEQVVRSDSLDQLIRRKLVEEYAKNNNIVVSQERIDNLYNQRVENAESEENLLTELDRLWGLDKQTYIDNLYYDLLREEVQNSLNTNLDDWTEQRYSEIDLVTNIE